MKMMRRFPDGGPYVSLVRFSTFASKFRWTSMDVVRLEKFMFNSSCMKEQNAHSEIHRISHIRSTKVVVLVF